MDMMTIRKMVMGQMASGGLDGFKIKKVTYEGTATTNDYEVYSWLIANCPSATMAFAFIEEYYSTLPNVNNQFISAQMINGDFQGTSTGIRYRSGAYTAFSYTSNYDVVINSGDIITFIYK